ncbi:unannotated protein [freshwater metagenome]|uniref:Unannotated protein n=1 Tax=freshwater metagenome TaxID=449393 RepID=A0A6J6KTI7_9ZZZZ|nr:glyoxalase/bleomycin resistance/extradiol dioxygenase family protein [Actinomycetota bacterium]
MRIDHFALWVQDLEFMRDFYATWFNAASSKLYENPIKGFASYFLTFPDGGRLEIMSRIDVDQRPTHEVLGYCHLSMSVGGEHRVDELSSQMQASGLHIIDGPRRTGDGYYEAVVLDPEGNRIELTA